MLLRISAEILFDGRGRPSSIFQIEYDVLSDAVHGADTLGFENSNNLGRFGFQRFGLGPKPHRLDDVASDAAGQPSGNGFNFR